MSAISWGKEYISSTYYLLLGVVPLGILKLKHPNASIERSDRRKCRGENIEEGGLRKLTNNQTTGNSQSSPALASG